MGKCTLFVPCSQFVLSKRVLACFTPQWPDLSLGLPRRRHLSKDRPRENQNAWLLRPASGSCASHRLFQDGCDCFAEACPQQPPAPTKTGDTELERPLRFVHQIRAMRILSKRLESLTA